MATYRNIQMTFWSDSKILEEFKPEDKLMFLYLMTNARTSNCGCYEIPLGFIANETGFSRDKVKTILARLQNKLDVIRYDFNTNEVLIINWSKYNWTSSPDFQKSVRYAISLIKNEEFKSYLTGCIDGHDTVPRPSTEGVGTTVTVTVTDNNINKSKSNIFIPPTEDQVAAYCKKRGYDSSLIVPSEFVDFYASKGWMVGSNKMVDWHRAIGTWISRRRRTGQPPKKKFNFDQHTDYNDAEIEAALTARM